MKTFTETTMELFHKIEINPENRLWYRNMIVECNLRLVAHVLKKYRPYTDDQYQAGCMGLIVAVDTFNKNREVPFASYACFCIEREIHKMYRAQKNFIENILADQMIFLDDTTYLNNGDEVNMEEIIPDTYAEEAFSQVLEENDLSALFVKIIIPSVENVANNTKGQEVKVDLSEWKTLELRYILELAEVESQKARLNLSQIAKALGLSVQNTRNKHKRVIEAVKNTLKENGYELN